MLLKKSSMRICSESYLTRKECYDLIKDHNMSSLSSLCKEYAVSPSLFVLNPESGLSLDDIYATKTDWLSFLDKGGLIADSSANALSHYLNPNNDRISIDSVFFTDSTSGVTLLNPRFVFLVNKSNKSLSENFKDIHKSLYVRSEPINAAEIENHYTEIPYTVESFQNPSFFLHIDWVNKGVRKDKKVKINRDVDSFINSLKRELNDSPASTDTSEAPNYRNDASILKSDLDLYTKQLDTLVSFQDAIYPSIKLIDELTVGKNRLVKAISDKLKTILSESLFNKVVILLKTGTLQGTPNINVSNKPILGSSLEEVVQSRVDYLQNKINDINNKLSSDIKDTPPVPKDDSDSLFDDYVEAVSKRMRDIYKYVTDNPRNSKGKIPDSLLTQKRNAGAVLFVLSPDSSRSHRCMGVRPFLSDTGYITYTFIAAGTEESTYSIKDDHITIS